MVADGAEHPRLQISEGHVVRKAAGVDLSVVVAVRIAAVDEDMRSPKGTHVRKRHRLVVKQQVRDRPGHSPIEARSKLACTNFRPRSIPGNGRNQEAALESARER
jgi:hypothetical protein